MSSTMNVVIIVGFVAMFFVGFLLGWCLCNRRRPHSGRSHRELMSTGRHGKTMMNGSTEDNLGGVKMSANGKHHDITALLSSPGRDFLIRNNGDKVKIESLRGKRLGLYFSASWCGPCQQFTPTLVEAYNQLRSKVDFEIVWVPSGERDDVSFINYLSKMPWLAIPYSDSNESDSLSELFGVDGIPRLVMLDDAGNVVTDRAVWIIREYGADAYPFTCERIRELKEHEEEIRKNQSLRSLLVHESRDFVVSSKGNKVSVSELEGSIIGLYFTIPSCDEFSGADLTPKLINCYNELKLSKKERFEIVWIPIDADEPSFEKNFVAMPWLALPAKDKTCEKLYRYFDLTRLPALVIIGRNGRTLLVDATGVVEEHGVAAYPFNPEKLVELEKKKIEGMPKKLHHAMHAEHELVLTRRSMYICDLCIKQGIDQWSYCCQECDFDLHPKCASSS